ncbi:PREDICTED: 1-phosphatidylinositol-3-phosphate 5-kinase FAB1B-like [Nelumbo nucifera]|uniref:1-phosphatidylinositol-3-phosphate 5-kinase n=1 Tax=Nelumbo nucifera TaxID=4432 RepID=A0A1U8A5H9_NELNU|nr:PREDICTED: 1-phosphatidylinositol-3-phosphate 5-kinase FAB1B-like [Nelumbo nucifera]XP_010261691.1 PREDICTED: 1-phosphatidylinositol-3-phosphate 5-kinase FAB1B-like [Nelumbo nucifera]
MDGDPSMGTPDNRFSELVGIVKSWIPRRTEPANLSRDFWMPDQSCRVCYDCDSQFTLFNRRHHCRLCGRVFCAKCTANSVPAPSDEPNTGCEDWERIRVCNYCFKQWEQGKTVVNNGAQASSPGLSPSPSATSLVSTKSTATGNSSSCTVNSMPFSTGPYQQVQYSSSLSPRQSSQMEFGTDKHDIAASGSSTDPIADIGDPSPSQFVFCMNRSDDDDEDDEYGDYQSDSEARHFNQVDDFYGSVEFDEIDHAYEPHDVHSDAENIERTGLSSSSLHESLDSQGLEGIKKQGEETEGHDRGDACEASASLYGVEGMEAEPVDFENNGLLWVPPEPEDEEDEREAVLFGGDDDDDDDDGATGEWGYLRSSSNLGSGEYRSRDRSSEEHRKAMKNVVDGHFRALVSQLLQVENLPMVEEDDKENWLEIVTSLSWEAATLLKPDTSKSGGMDPGGYVKVKCIACGHRSESMVVKGVVCKKNVAHRRMASKIEKPRFLILGGALEYQRVSNLLSSFDTLLQQEMDHLKMAVAKIDAHHPNVLLVEKSVSRFAQDYLLAKDISLVLNIKRPLLERIARCMGAQIVPSIDHLSSQKLGYCDSFHVEKFLEEHGSAGQGGKKLVKTLMFFEDCPKPLGCTILLKGANGDELKKVKHVVQYGVFAAYHLALETSFLADEGASLPELPLKSPITVALPDKPSSIDKSISTIPDFAIAAIGKCQGPQSSTELQKSGRVLTSDVTLPIRNGSNSKMEMALSPCLPKDLDSQYKGQDPSYHSSGFFHALTPSRQFVSDSYLNEPDPHHAFEDKDRMGCEESFEVKPSASNCSHKNVASHLISNGFGVLETSENGGFVGNGTQIDCNAVATNNPNASELASLQHDSNNYHEGQGPSKEEFPPSPSDNQSILVSLSTRCVWKGTVCERAHLFRIKYYGNFDKPLGRFLRDHLFDQSYCCHSCEMPSEAHVHCYTHRQGSVTISVKKLPEFLLPGEREGKIWMWHRCLRCPRTNGFPPATQRVVMSDAAWGLSFGKFLELSFSNHTAASRVASCGHSLHRDCLRFYGFGRMVACFRYGSIDVHSVYLPPSKLDFNYGSQEWIQKEAKEVVDRTELLFTEVLNSLHEIVEKRSGLGFLKSGVKAAESRHRVAELEGIIQKEKAEFEESLHKALNREAKKGQPIIDILEINRLQRQLLFQSYVWDRRLIYTANLDNDHQEGLSSSMAKSKEKTLDSIEKLVEMNTSNNTSKALSSCDSIWDGKPDESLNQGGSGEQPNQDALASQGREMNQDPNNEKEGMVYLSTGQKFDDQFDPLESGVIRRVLSEGHFPIMASLSDTLDAAWTGENHPGSATPRENSCTFPDAAVVDSSVMIDVAVAKPELEEHLENRDGAEISQSLGPARAIKGTDNVYDTTSWVSMPFLNFYRSFNKISSGSAPKLDTLSGYDPVYVTSFRDLERQGGTRFLLPIGFNDTVVPVYDDEPTSIISYALVSQDYHAQMSDERDRPKDGGDSLVSLPSFDLVNFHSFHLFDEMTSESFRSLGSTDDSILSMSGSRSSLMLEPLLSTKALHVRVSVTDDGPLGKVRYTVTCYYAKRFEALRRTCCPFELDFIRSLSRCKKWGAQGGKSNVFFAKTLDDRFIVKQVTKTELESFIKFAPEYFKYLSDSIGTGSPTCLAKILGIYQVTSKHLKGGKESRMDVLVMENLLFGRNVTRLYDLKGSSRSRYNPDSSGTNKVLLDQNLIEAMPTSPIFVGNKAKRLLERAVWNDTSFLASIDVMDYSLLVGVDEVKHELVVGIIDFMRQYTWDKHLETWVKASGILGGPKNSSPTVISPKQYKKRFRKAMSAYFLMVPDQWSPSTIIPNGSQLDVCEENAQGGASLE